MCLHPAELKVCLFDGVAPTAISTLAAAGFTDITHYPDALPETELKAVLAEAQIVGIRSKTQLSREVLSTAKKLICVGRYGVGVNNIDLSAAQQLGIPVFNGPYANTRSVAELVIGNIICLLRSIPRVSAAMHAGQWPKVSKGLFEARGKTLGIIGYGHIGSQVSVLAEALGMKVIYNDIRTLLPLGQTQSVSFDELLQRSDIVTLHVPATPQTANMIDAAALQKMRSGSMLINCSRGSVVDIPALKQALQAGHLAGAALDVFPKEPKTKEEAFDSELQSLPNVIFTPHIGGTTEEALSALGTEVSAKMADFALRGDSTMAVNFPEIAPGTLAQGRTRVMVIHRNQPGMLAAINEAFSEAGLNISAQTLKTLDEVGVAVVDAEGELPRTVRDQLISLSHVIKCRVI